LISSATLVISLSLFGYVFAEIVTIKWKPDWRNVSIADRKHHTDVGVQERDGVYYYPLRFLAEYLGHKVYWIDNEKSALIRGQGRNIQIWRDRANYVSAAREVEYTNQPFIYQNRLLVSSDFVDREFGLETKITEPDEDGYFLEMEIDSDLLLPHAIDFTLETQNGGTINFSEQLEREDVKCILLNFWSTRCLPCNKELPALVKLYDKYKDDGLLVLGVCTDSDGLEAERAELIEYLEINYPIPLDPLAETYYKWGGLGVPNMTLVNKEGLIVWQHDGYSPETPGIAEVEIKKLLDLD